MIIKNNKGESPLFSLENIYDAYLKCRKNKRNTINALKFEVSLPDNLIDLHDELDQFVKHRLKCKYYIRYCDDFVLLSNQVDQLEKWHGEIGEFLHDRLKLALNPSQTKLSPVSSGIDFLGYITRRRYTLVRRRVINNFKERIRYFDGRLSVRDRDKKPVRWNFPPDEVELFRSTVVSYLGHLKWADSFTLKRILFMKYPVLRACFILNGYEVIPRYIPPVGSTRFSRKKEWTGLCREG